MTDIGKHLQRAYDDGYRRGAKDALDDIHKTFESSLREKVSHLTEPNNCKPQTEREGE